jgi:hypothetical protein
LIVKLLSLEHDKINTVKNKGKFLIIIYLITQQI